MKSIEERCRCPSPCCYAPDQRSPAACPGEVPLANRDRHRGPSAADDGPQLPVRAAAAGLSWPLPDDLDDRGLEERLFGRPAPRRRSWPPGPDWEIVHAELRRPGVTQALLWSEYRERHPTLRIHWFTESYHAYVGKLDLVMRQNHHAGEKCFWTSPATRSDRRSRHRRDPRAQLFVAVLGASSYTYAEACPPGTHPLVRRARAGLRVLRRVPAILVPDNLRSRSTSTSL